MDLIWPEICFIGHLYCSQSTGALLTVASIDSMDLLTVQDTSPRLIWNPSLEGDAARAVVELLNSSVDGGGMLGYAAPLSQRQALTFIDGLARRVASDETHLLLGLAGASPAIMVVMTQSAMPNCRHTAELSKGLVHPEWRGRHLVSAAFRALAARAKLLGIEQFVLDVREGSRAHALWQRFGFVSYGVLDDYARVEGRAHRGHYMAQSVQSLADRVSGTSALNHKRMEHHDAE